MKKHFLTLFIFLFVLLLNASAMTLYVSCQGNNETSITTYCSASINGSYTWSVLKNGTPISTTTTKSNIYSYTVNPIITGYGYYSLTVTYKRTLFAYKTETSNDQFCNVADANFTMNFDNSSSKTLCSTVDSLIIQPTSGVISNTELRIYSTNGLGGPAGTQIFNQSNIGPTIYYFASTSTLLLPGNYYLVDLTAYGNCGSAHLTKYLYIDNACKMGVLNTADIDTDNSINVYPNPVETALAINGVTEINKVQVYNAQGRIEKTFEELEGGSIDLSELQSGIYLIHLFKNDGKVVVKKIVKK